MSEITPKKRGAGRPRAFDTNQALDKAVRLFWRHGYEATSMSDLVAELGVGVPSLYAAFGNKAGLFAAVVERYAATFSAALYAPIRDENLTTQQAVEELFARAAHTFSEPDTPAGCFMYSAAAAVAPASVEIELMLRAKRAAAEGELTDRLAQGVQRGELAAEVNAAALAKYLNCVMEGMSVQARDGATLEDLQAIARMALAHWPT